MSKGFGDSEYFLYCGKRVQMALWMVKVANPWTSSKGMFLEAIENFGSLFFISTTYEQLFCFVLFFLTFQNSTLYTDMPDDNLQKADYPRETEKSISPSVPQGFCGCGHQMLSVCQGSGELARRSTLLRGSWRRPC